MMSDSSNLENMLGVNSSEPEDVHFPIINACQKDTDASFSISISESFT